MASSANFAPNSDPNLLQEYMDFDPQLPSSPGVNNNSMGTSEEPPQHDSTLGSVAVSPEEDRAGIDDNLPSMPSSHLVDDDSVESPPQQVQ